MNFINKRLVFLLLVLASANTLLAENLFNANYEEIDKVVWSYFADTHPEINSKELKISAYSFQKVSGARHQELINVILNYEVEVPATAKKKIKIHGKATYRGAILSEEKNSRTMTLLINQTGQVVRETTGKKNSKN